MVGPQSPSMQVQLGPLLNGFVDFTFWLPVKTMQFPGALEFVKRYQAKAGAAGVDPFGYYIAPWAYADLQVLGQAINDTKSIDDAKIAADFHSATFHTVVGDVKFGKDGEWAVPRVIQTQFRDIAGNGVAQFRDVDQTQAVVTPPDYKTGDLIYPYGNAKLPGH